MRAEFTKYQYAGLKLLLKHIKRYYPFIVDLIPDYDLMDKYGTHLFVNIKFDLEKFYKITGNTPPKDYETHPFLYELLVNESLYLMRYVDSDLSSEFGNEYNKLVEDSLNVFYKHLPEYMRHSKFEGWTDSEFEEVDKHNIGVDFYKRWQEQKEPLDVHLSNWVPIFDPSKYYTKED
jgi:hypothetical protein